MVKSLVSVFGFESSLFAILCLAAARASQPTFWHFAATIPYSFLCAYSISRAALALSLRTSRPNELLFQAHRIVGILCQIYSFVIWYKLVILKNKEISQNMQQLYDTSRFLGASSVLFNYVSGTLLFPKIPKRTPMVLRQSFVLGSSLGIATFLIIILLQLRAWYPLQAKRHPAILATATLTVAWNILAVFMGISTVYILSQEKEPSGEDTRKETRVREKPARNDLSSFFFDLFVSPQNYVGTMAHKENLKYLAYGSKQASQVVVLASSSVPAIAMGLVALNLATCSNIPIFDATHSSNGSVPKYFLSTFEMLAWCTTPAATFDLTLVLTKRISPTWVAFESTAAVLLGIIGPLMLAFSVLSENDRFEYFSTIQIMFWPLLGRV